QPGQRPSWNYRKEEGGGIIVDMLCHWRYVLDNLFGEVRSVSCRGATHIPERYDESGRRYDATADDAAYATFELDGDIIAQINSSWAVRVYRDELFVLQVDGTHGSAVAGLRECRAQHRANTPRPIWNPDIPNPIVFRDGWQEVPDNATFENAFKIQWEMFLRHIAGEAPFRWDFLEAAKGVQLAELGLRSWSERRWIDIPTLEI
ncbi:MAG TPA: Gfo/Idh/MocA family oxidoreductase, partial [Roseiflexaceae bacterium]|nr:Gfo/Idh/MocA family oxidoreductase [Roseiflexaceae bacterium]